VTNRRKTSRKKIEQYEHSSVERLNNPPVGLVTTELDPTWDTKEYEYDPHLDPQLVWAGKAERTNFEVDTVSLHVHERIDPKTIITAVRKNKVRQQELASFFTSPGENPPLRDAIEFYRHKHGWSNRLIAGDSLLVMNSLLEKEGMTGKVQMIYIDPPYGIKYQSNFQPFVNKRDVKDGKDEDLTQEPEMIKAFRDTWELEIHSYLTYLRDRLLLAHELIDEKGSVFVQISDENIHHVREIMDEIFGKENFCGIIAFRKTGGLQKKLLASIVDYLLWYAKNIINIKYHQLYLKKRPGDIGATQYRYMLSEDNVLTQITPSELLAANEEKVFTHDNLTSQGNPIIDFNFNGRVYSDRYKTTIEGLKRLVDAGRIIAIGNTLRYIRYLQDFPYTPINEFWHDTGISGFAEKKKFVVQTSPEVIERCILMTTDPGDLVLDPTCGGGTTAFAAEKWGRRWITCDTSRVAITLTKQRLMTALYDYYELANLKEDVTGGFKYNTVHHITLGSIARNEISQHETLFDQPYVDSSKARITGPFTVEAVPAPIVKSITKIEPIKEADRSISREGETFRQSQWRSELLKTGIRGKGGQKIEFIRIEALSGTIWLHADAETKEVEPKRAVISFGPEFAPLDQKQVELSINEAQRLVPKPQFVIFASFQFDPEASKDINETIWPGVTLLQVQMNADLLTEDLKKERASNESFWLIGQPDVKLTKLTKDEYQVEVQGFDYYNSISGEIESGGSEKIAMWMLDTDYDYRSLFPRQVFFPLENEREGWSRLAHSLRSEIDEDLIEQYRGTISLPFELGENKIIAVKIVDDRGIESLKIIKVS